MDVGTMVFKMDREIIISMSTCILRVAGTLQCAVPEPPRAACLNTARR